MDYKGIDRMDTAKYCRLQAQECRRLLALPQGEAAAQVLRNLCRSWVGIANQVDRYAEIVRRESRSEKSKAASGLSQSPPRGRSLANHGPAIPLPEGDKDGGR
jgi:hypothetical protein